MTDESLKAYNQTLNDIFGKCVSDVGDETFKQRAEDQPLPTPNERMDVQSQVILDIKARRDLGRQRYGTALQPFNGRDPDRDLYEELLDAVMYQKQSMLEHATSEVELAQIAYAYFADYDDPKRPLCETQPDFWIGLIRALRIAGK